ncbi:MAG: hypothetical protein M9953_01930 [Thermomicrobiales bacterium]|nr:hypothetical protein [Thermomicrobiales bacterium]
MESRSRLSNALQGNRVPELDALGYEAVIGRDGRVVLAGGTQANVGCVRDHSGRLIAARVASDHNGGVFWQRHYGSMESGLPRSVRSYFPARIEPLTSGITLVGRKVPTVLMEWIDGPTLLAAISRAASSRNSDVLTALAHALRDLSIGLRDGRVTHGDLTPQNLMLRSNGDIVCVDLDTLEWPGARKRVHDDPVHAYRHPRRAGTPAHQDAFAILVMFTSTILLRETPLLQISAEASEPGDSAMVFSSWDLRDHDGSAMFASVREQTTPLGRAMLDVLIRACDAEAFRAQEMLDAAFDMLPMSPTEPVRIVEETTLAPPPESPEELDIKAAVARLRELYGGGTASASKPAFSFADTWPEAVEQPMDRLPDVEPVWHESVVPQTVDVVRRPIERLTRRSGRDLARVLEDEARAAHEIDQGIAIAAKSHDDELILSLARAATREQLVLEESSRRLIRRAQERTAVRAKLAKALETNDRRALADLAVSGDLALLGDTTRESLVKVLQALEWPSLLRALETDDDALIMLWYDEELFDDPRSLPTAMRMRVDLARQRLQWLEDVRAKMHDRDAESLEMLVTNEPDGGRQRLSPAERRRVGELIDRKRSLSELDRSLRSGNMQRVVSALAAVEQTGASIEDPQTWSQVRQIVTRSEVVQAAIAAASANPPDDRTLAAIVPRLKELGIAHDPALRGDYSIDKLESIIIRGAAVRRIRRTIQQNDDRAIRLAAFPDTTGALSWLTASERERVETARARKRVKRLDV